MPYGVYEKSEEHKKKLTEVLRPFRFKKGITPWNKGIVGLKGTLRPKSLEQRAKISKSLLGKPSWNKGIKGSKSHAYKGGKSTLTGLIRASSEYSEWRADVFRRDGWTCQTCGFRGHGKDIEAHHIVSMKEILSKHLVLFESADNQFLKALTLPELFSVDNGVTLCRTCHIKAHL